MASELRVNTLKDASGNNSVGMSTVSNGSAKMWSCFNGTGTVAIKDSFNQSTLTDNGNGDQTVAFTNSMGNSNYSSTGACLGGSTDGSNYAIFGCEDASAATTKTSSNLQCTSGFVANVTAGASHVNHQDMNLAIHGDLA